MGTIPLIVVYTLLDLAVDECTMELATARCDLDDENIIKLASSEVESNVQRQHERIKQLVGEPLPYTAVSSKEDYRHTFQNLVELTCQQPGVGTRSTHKSQR